MISVIHAFSRRNSGDSLLVDLTLTRLQEAGCPSDSIEVLALDPESFGDLPNVIAVPGEPWGRASTAAVRAAIHGVGNAISTATRHRLRIGIVAERLSNSDGIVAVGGGYLRTVGASNSLGTALNHLPQLASAAVAGMPSVYLPQSIGPLNGPVGSMVRRRLGQLSAVHVRDDRSVAELPALKNVHRTPDLAVLAVADQQPTPSHDLTGTPIVVARQLPRTAGYVEHLRALSRALPDARWAVQAAGLGDRSDACFYESIGVQPLGTLKEVIADEAGAVVSVRLHGALQAVIEGLPAIHLSYERKGWGAYRDLNLGEFVHSARHFDPLRVARQVSDLGRDPSDYWSQLGSRIDRLRVQSEDLTGQLRSYFAP